MTKSFGSFACMMVIALAASAETIANDSASPAAAVSGPATSFGTQTTPSTSASPAAEGGRAVPFRGKISNVDAKAKTFAVGTKEKNRTFKVSDRTTITRNGQPATLKDVTTNEEVRGSYWKMPDGSMEVKTLKVVPAADQPTRTTAGAAKKEKTAASPPER